MAYDFKVPITVNGVAIAAGDHTHAPGAATNADTVDNQHASEFAASSHGHDYAASNHGHAAGDATTLDSYDSADFALLAGRSGGQTLYGGTAANEDITIEGTIHATKATSYVILQPNGGDVVVGTSSSTAKLQVYQVDPSARVANFVGQETSGVGVVIASGVDNNDVALAVGDHDEIAAFQVWAGGNVDVAGILYVGSHVDADHYLEHTPGYEGDALDELSRVRNTKDGQIDHDSLPPAAHRKVAKKGTEESRRDLGMMVSILTKAFQEQMQINRTLIARLDALESKK